MKKRRKPKIVKKLEKLLEMLTIKQIELFLNI